MPIQQLPLIKGVGKNFKTADYIDYLPVNMLATPKEVLNSNGYLRSFPGVTKLSDVAGTSRGAEYNTSQNSVYRVMGGKLYRSNAAIGNVAGSSRVSMAHGRTSQAVCVNGNVIEYRYDGTTKTIANWPVESGYTQYELGSARDVTRLRGRYAWAKDNSDSWFITDLEDESHPDRYSAEYRAESQPDGIIGIGTWREFIVCFGSSTIEYFTLTGTSTVGAALYVANPAYMVPKGIAGTFCKCVFMDAYAIVSNPATGAPSVYIIDSGRATPIATASIEKILREYTAGELSTAVMESLRFDSHELLMIHLPRHVLVYDGTASQNGPQWCILKTGLYDDVYRAIDFMYEGNTITQAIQLLDVRLTTAEGKIDVLRNDVDYLIDEVADIETTLANHETRIDALEYATTRKKSEVVYTGISQVIPTTATNLITLLKALTPSSGTLLPFFNTTTDKLTVYNENKTLNFKLSMIGSYPGGTTNRSMQLTFSGAVPDTLVASRNAATATDNILLATFFSVDQGGFLATNGSTITIQSNGAAFTATTIKIIAEQ